MDASHDHVEVPEGFARTIKAPVRADIAFHTGKYLKAIETAVEPFDLGMLSGQLLSGHATGNLRASCMVADGDIPIPEGLCRLCHLLYRMGTVAP
jgi:hypothetical protein